MQKHNSEANKIVKKVRKEQINEEQLDYEDDEFEPDPDIFN